MKKTLAMILALLMLSASLAACKKENPNPNLDDEEDDGYVSTNNNNNNNDNTDNNDNNDNNENNNNENDNQQTPSTGVWVDRNNETVYVGMNGVNLRTGPGTSYSAALKVNAGQQLTRKETNGTWDKVMYNDQEYYIATDLVTTNGNDFNIVAKDTPVTLTIAEGYTIILRSTAFDPMKGSTYYEANIALYGVSATNGGTLTKVGVSESGDWYKVSYVGTFGGVTYTGTENLYMHKNNVLLGYVVDPEVPVGSNPGTNPGIG